MAFLAIKRGYTIVELMVTIVIVTALAATVGTFVVKLLTLRENDREDAYIREKLIDVCGTYADLLSVGSSLNTNGPGIQVTYRQETGGVSFETGIVSQVTSLISDVTNGMVKLNIYGLELEESILKYVRQANGNADLIPQAGNIVSCTVTPINATDWQSAALGNLRLEARYQVRNGDGNIETKATRIERIVRLWNHE